MEQTRDGEKNGKVFTSVQIKREIEKMIQPIWSNRAFADLNFIAEYLASHAEYAAKKYIQELITKANILLSPPEMVALFLKIFQGIAGKSFARVIG